MEFRKRAGFGMGFWGLLLYTWEPQQRLLTGLPCMKQETPKPHSETAPNSSRRYPTDECIPSEIPSLSQINESFVSNSNQRFEILHKALRFVEPASFALFVTAIYMSNYSSTCTTSVR